MTSSRSWMYRCERLVSTTAGVMPVKVLSTISLLQRAPKARCFYRSMQVGEKSVLQNHKAGLREFEHAVLAVVAAESRTFPAGVETLIRIGRRAVHVQLASFDLIGHTHGGAIVLRIKHRR